MVRESNDSRVLRAIISDPKVSDRMIAKKLNLSAAGVGKIRKKLESRGTISGYETRISPSEMNLNAFAILHVQVTNEGWKYHGRIGIKDKLAQNPNVVGMYRVPGRDVNYVLICAFRDLNELDRFLAVEQSSHTDYLRIVESFVFSSEGIVKDSYKDLLLKLLDEGADTRYPEPIYFGEVAGEKK